MSINYDIGYEDLYNMNMSGFYEYVAEIMSDFSFIFHKSSVEVNDKRRGEVWVSKKYDNDFGMVWIELTKEGKYIAEDIPTDILRTMNDENVTKLFFFTNGGIAESVNDIIKGQRHYIFDPSDIIETVQTIKKRKDDEESGPKRKSVNNPSGFILLRNYLKSNKAEENKYNVKVNQIKEIAEKMVKRVENPLEMIDSIQDMDNIPKETSEKLKKIQHALLPEIIKLASLNFGYILQGVKESIINLLKSTIIYIGTVINYESEDSMKKYREDVDKILENLRGVGSKIDEYKKLQIDKATNISFKLILISVIVIITVLFLYIMVIR